MKRGKFIVIEGGDAAGKNTQTKLLRDRLEDHRNAENHVEDARFEMPGSEIRDIFTRPWPMLFSFPRYGTPVGVMILKHLKGELELDDSGNDTPMKSEFDDLAFQCMMLADKVEAAYEISKVLDSGAHVISDRWWQSAVVYGSLDGMDAKWLERTSSMLPQADVNVLIDVPMDVAVARRPLARDRYESDYQKRSKIADGYMRLWLGRQASEEKLGRRWCAVDGSQAVEAVADEIWDIVSGTVGP